MSKINMDTPITINVFNSRCLSKNFTNSQSKCVLIDRTNNDLYAAFTTVYDRLDIYKSTDDGFSWSLWKSINNYDYDSEDSADNTNVDYLNLIQSSDGGLGQQLMHCENLDYIVIITPSEANSAGPGGVSGVLTPTYTFINKDSGTVTYRTPHYAYMGDGVYLNAISGSMISFGSPDHEIMTAYKNPNNKLEVAAFRTNQLIYNPNYTTINTYTCSDFDLTSVNPPRFDAVSKDKYGHIIGNTQNFVSYVRYNKTDGSFDQFTNLSASGHEAKDPCIAIDGSDNLMITYGDVVKPVASGFTANLITSPNYPTRNYGGNANVTEVIDISPATYVRFNFSGMVTDGPNDKIWFTDSSDNKISKYYASIKYEDGSSATPNSGWWYTPGWPLGNVAFSTTGMYVADGIIKLRFTSTSSLSSGIWLVSGYTSWADTGSDSLAYNYSVDGGSSWSTGNITLPTNYNQYVDKISNSGTYNLSLLGLQDDGFTLSSTLSSGNHTDVMIKKISKDGSSYKMDEEWKRVNSKSNINSVGCQYFRYGDEKLQYYGNGKDIRVAYQIGSGTNNFGNDVLRSTINQERIANNAYADTLPSVSGSYTIDSPKDGNMLLTFNVVSMSDSEDYYNIGMTGVYTNKYINAIDKVGTPMRVLKYNLNEDANGLGESTYSDPIEYTTKVMIDPITYDFPSIAEEGSDFDTTIERDIRKVYFKPDLYMSRNHTINNGAFIRRNIWTIEFMGNEYEVSQIVPKFIKNEICFYEANVYVIGPSNNPFKKLTLPSET